ncbi:type II secretion system protein [Candidatus Peribacteria bacterium]|jgi:prepilin-type N-terminal cleavage/methylation domain-containing protein|nr:type II secretion system protein [Candidatus Peribacteria bacterium]MBT4021715.1 type II secretion system protein [Candidatus Peribacteria bacterium]MBT4241178.1 type II secretion system protein [Candidatus Peribacteria bacterium]MBT4473931.1 type II secretion system protein [Candidatus Peribacteria bacterium]
MSKHKAFTLVELLLAIAIMGILAGIVIVAINPGKQMGDARNTQRKFDVNTILNAFGQYAIDANGLFQPVTVDGSILNDACIINSNFKNMCKGDISLTDCVTSTCVWSRHLSGAYIASIPEDPGDDESSAIEQLRTDYLVRSIAPGRFEVAAPNAENDSIIGAVR